MMVKSREYVVIRHMATHSKHILCIGGGLLGLPVAKHFAKNHEVTIIKRSPVENALGITVNCADISNPLELERALPEKIDIILYCLSPTEFTEAGYRKAFPLGIANLLSALRNKQTSPQQLLFVSSTSVYHQNDNTTITEDSPTLPSAFSGKALIEAEHQLQTAPYPATIIRFSGIYGGNRTRLLEQALNGLLVPQEQEIYTNRIHETDCIRVLCHLIQLAIEDHPIESLYIATDCSPVSTNDLASWFNQHLKCQPTAENATPGKRRAGSKRCSNRRLLESGYQFIYPSWKEGYNEMIQRLYADHAR